MVLPLKSSSRSRSRSRQSGGQAADLDAPIFISNAFQQPQRPMARRLALREVETAVMARDRASVSLALARLRNGEAGISSYLESAWVSPADVSAQARHVAHTIRERSKLWPGCQGGFYIGCSARETPEHRWFLETDQPHYMNY